MNEITFNELKNKDKDAYEIIDVRDEDSFNYGHIPGAINIPASDILSGNVILNLDKEIYLYCRTRNLSENVVEFLQEQGYKAFNLTEGYFGYLKDHINDFNGNQKALDVEKSINKKFNKELFSKFCKAINDYELISPGDKIAVCISGGKDSMLMAKLFQELKRRWIFHQNSKKQTGENEEEKTNDKLISDFDVVFLVMDPGYSKENREIIERNAQMLNIPITIFETDIFENVFNIEKSPCYICARMRRGYLYSKAKALGCNKIALGHHYDDVIETILMGMLYSGQFQTMMPKLKSSHFEGMELIRPMYLIREEDVKHWRDYNDLHFIQCACKFTETCTSEACMTSKRGTGSNASSSSKRLQTKKLIATLKKDDPMIENNIFKSVESVNLSTIISYKDRDGNLHSFKDNF